MRKNTQRCVSIVKKCGLRKNTPAGLKKSFTAILWQFSDENTILVEKWTEIMFPIFCKEAQVKIKKILELRYILCFIGIKSIIIYSNWLL